MPTLSNKGKFSACSMAFAQHLCTWRELHFRGPGTILDSVSRSRRVVLRAGDVDNS